MPSYDNIGLAAPFIVLILRLVQGLALGGEYGGATTYVAEHSPDNQRGYYTSFIQTTATVGLFCEHRVIMGTRKIVGEDAFKEWGWRIPFLLSGASWLLLPTTSAASCTSRRCLPKPKPKAQPAPTRCVSRS